MVKKGNKKPPNKKVRSLLFRDKAVVEQKKRLKALTGKRKEIHKCLTDIAQVYNDIIEGLNSGSLNSLPLETINDIVRFADGYKNDYKLPMIKLRADLKKEYIEASEEIKKLTEAIRASQIDVLLVKAECMQRKMD